MRVEQRFTIRRPPGDVFAYVVEPSNLADWQTSKVAVEPLTDGAPRAGYRVKERTKVGLRQWDQVVEFTEFEPGRALSTHIVEGSMPVDGRWTFADDGQGGTTVHFVAEGALPWPVRLLQPVIQRGIDRSFRRCHAQLARNLEERPASG